MQEKTESPVGVQIAFSNKLVQSIFRKEELTVTGLSLMEETVSVLLYTILKCHILM